MTKAELIYNTLHSVPQTGNDTMNDINYFLKFLSEKYDDEILQTEMKMLKEENESAFHIFSDEKLFTAKQFQ